VYKTVGIQECLRNLVTLAAPHLPRPIASRTDLTEGLLGFYAVRNGVRPAGHRILSDEAEIAAVFEEFGLGTAQAGAVADRRTAELFERTLDTIDEDLRSLARLLFTDIALLDGDRAKAGSGVTYRQLGLVYFSPATGWTVQDVAECVVHELTHLLLYFDELCLRHYVDEPRTAAIGDFGRTAITGTPREAKVVFHSLVIAAEIVTLRRASFGGADGIHGSAADLRSTALACGRDLLGRPDLAEHLTPRGIRLAELAVAALEGDGERAT
jgi:hypothetical protein